MEGQKKDLEKILQQVQYRSYLGHMNVSQKVVQKSKLQILQIKAENKIKENDFNINIGYKLPQPNDFNVFQKSSLVYLSTPSFFSCLSSRRVNELSLKNFVLTATQGSNLIFSLDFDLIQCEVYNSGNGLKIRMEKSLEQFYFQLKNQHQQIQKWKKLLTQVIDKSKGKLKHYIYLPTYVPDFYKNPQICNQKFIQQCNTGDILLFKSQHGAARVQRFFTDSQYDHVAVILRNKKNQLFVFQSTGDIGVGLTPWKHIVKYEWYKYTLKIAWRRLNIKLDQNDAKIIEKFIEETINNQFQISLGKLFTFQSRIDGSKIGNQKQRDPKDKEKRKFFCSELIAKLYKNLKLLDEVKSATQYFPVHFSQAHRLEIIKHGVFLERQKIIAFNY